MMIASAQSDDYLSAADVFPEIGLKGGVCYFLWDRDHPGLCQTTTHFKDWPTTIASRRLLEPGANVFIRFEKGLSVLRKVMTAENGTLEVLSLPDEKRFSRIVSTQLIWSAIHIQGEVNSGQK
ncbi:MAG: Eco57I restriction-modification methylase domain-containing protein [Thermomicrobiales bacterium]|nr:Eco57I restriction-modification methylase domain-containing protein [Thermomicrobiales bacterium]